jgi:hypothetical protein
LIDCEERGDTNMRHLIVVTGKNKRHSVYFAHAIYLRPVTEELAALLETLREARR